MEQSIINKILNKIKKCGRGSAFFTGDFIHYGPRNSVSKALERLTDDGTLIRVSRGIYCYPKIEKVYGLGAVTPSYEAIAHAIARKDGAKIVPSGTYAQYQLGLTQQIPMNYNFLTNGPSRTLTLNDQQSITFRHASPRYFTINDELALLLTTALKDWKVENLSDEQLSIIQKRLKEHGPIPVADLKLIPSPIRELIRISFKI